MDDKPHILIVDDDKRIGDLLTKFLSKAGYLTSFAKSANEAMQLLNYYVFDLIILDVMMPRVTGIEFATKLRKNKVHIPIMMLTALGEIEDRIAGLSAGANDYLPKPFEPRELLLRAENLIKLYGFKQSQDNIMHIGDLTYNKSTRELLRNNCEITLTSTEWLLFEKLIELNAKPISRSELAEILGGVNERSVDVQINRLREKIETNKSAPKYLQTIRNKGYVLYVR